MVYTFIPENIIDQTKISLSLKHETEDKIASFLIPNNLKFVEN